MNTSVMIYSCDAYSDVWGPFFTLFFRYWNCPYDVYLASETEYCLLPGVGTITEQAPTWTERMRASLMDIPAKYVICMCEDMFIRQTVRQNIIDECIQAMENDPSIACFNFEYDKNVIPGGPVHGFGQKARDAEYKKSCQPTLWRKQVLQDLLDVNMAPWEWETTPADDRYKYYVWAGAESDLVFEYGYHDGKWFGIQKGKWVAQDVGPLFKREQISVDLSIRGTI